MNVGGGVIVWVEVWHVRNVSMVGGGSVGGNVSMGGGGGSEGVGMCGGVTMGECMNEGEM